MIFVTVGTQIPFDRMVKAVDAWAGAHPEQKIFAQIGGTSWRPQHLEWVDFLTPEGIAAKLAEAELIIAHAGTGSILGALSLRKPILIMARLPEYGEHRNDHQRTTAEAFAKLDNIYLAEDEAELPRQLDALTPPPAFAGEALGPYANEKLLAALRTFIETGKAPEA